MAVAKSSHKLVISISSFNLLFLCDALELVVVNEIEFDGESKLKLFECFLNTKNMQIFETTI